MLKLFSTRLPLTQSQHGPGFDPMVQGLYRIIRDCGLTESDPGEFLPAGSVLEVCYTGTALINLVRLINGEASREHIATVYGDGIARFDIPENCLGFEWASPDGFRIESVRISKNE